MTRDQLLACTKKRLTELARAAGIPGWHGMTKELLVQALSAKPSKTAARKSVEARKSAATPVSRTAVAKPRPRVQVAAARNTSGLHTCVYKPQKRLLGSAFAFSAIRSLSSCTLIEVFIIVLCASLCLLEFRPAWLLRSERLLDRSDLACARSRQITGACSLLRALLSPAELRFCRYRHLLAAQCFSARSDGFRQCRVRPFYVPFHEGGGDDATRAKKRFSRRLNILSFSIIST